MPLVVEFTGARGVGKSTLSALLREELVSRGVPLREAAVRPLVGRARMAVNGLQGFARAWWDLSQKRPVQTIGSRVLARRLWRYLQRMRAFTSGRGVCLLEEGIFQLVMMLYARNAHEDMNQLMSAFGRTIPLPDVVISIRATEEAIAARRAARANRRDLLKPQVSAAGREGLRRVEHLLQVLSSAGRLQLIVVETDDRELLGQTASEIADVLEARLERAQLTRHVRLSGRSKGQAT